MKCPTCQTDTSIMGCRVSDSPFHWCPNCGTIQPCDDTPAIVPAVLSRISPAAYLPVGAHLARDRAPAAGPGPVTGRGNVMAKLRAEADRECIIEPHVYHLNDKGTNACKDCGLDLAHPIHTRGNHGQETD